LAATISAKINMTNIKKKMPPVRIQGASTIACHMKIFICYRLLVLQAILTGKINYFLTAGESTLGAIAGLSTLGAIAGLSTLGAETGVSTFTAGLSVFAADSDPLPSLQAASAATTAKAKNTFFIFCNF
jgi:hypothetical protein